uniref:BACK domain-containing protein n=1 Tax=Parascaris univalens TaxID=6257 RepID=A0A914ZGH1_PARUN
MTASGSRFKIVPIETRYNRGRWACWDYYDTEAGKGLRGQQTDLQSLNIHVDNGKSSSAASGHVSRSRNEPVTFTFDFSDESDAENTPLVHKYPEATSDTIIHCRCQSIAPQVVPILETTVSGQHECIRRLVASPDFSSTSGGRITPSEMIQNYGLERSLSATHTDKAILDLLPGATVLSGTSQVSGTQPQSTTKSSPKILW